MKAKRTTIAGKSLAFLVSIFVNGLTAILIIFGSASDMPAKAAEATSDSQLFHCRYFSEGRLFQIETSAASWQEAERAVCGLEYRDVVVPPLFIEGVRIVVKNPEAIPVVAAQRESCSCSEERIVPILQDVGIVEAPRIGTQEKQKALPRIVNTPEATVKNTITTVENTAQKKVERKRDKVTTDDLLNAIDAFDEARPVSQSDAGGSADGSRTSKSATGKGDPYLQKVKARLDNAMNAPASIPKSELNKLSATLRMKIGDNGLVWSWEFAKKSRNAAFDMMIERTMKKFTLGGDSKFPAPPEQWRLQSITVMVKGSEIR